MNRRQFLGSAAVLPAVGGAFSATATQQKQIKITTLETDVHKQPPGAPTYDAIHKLGVDSGTVAPRLRTDADYRGESRPVLSSNNEC
jgi:hypothetical protein